MGSLTIARTSPPADIPSPPDSSEELLHGLLHSMLQQVQAQTAARAAAPVQSDDIASAQPPQIARAAEPSIRDQAAISAQIGRAVMQANEQLGQPGLSEDSEELISRVVGGLDSLQVSKVVLGHAHG